ncbi:thioester reductase domain-containing protein [Haloactinospora alba]|uniref:thioester reductase domain-containing protein n=1 Tax=Haloactinospora alba TaxID=405555 RepID=UPI0014775D35|nr:thioester reductase domain-containing protein [Haloactinospora alba]
MGQSHEEGRPNHYWKDAVLPESVAPKGDHPAFPPGNILLTGSTGYLGGYIMAELLQDTDAVLYCLVRGRSEGEARDRLAASLENRGVAPVPHERLRVVPGNMAKPNFGLSESEYDSLAESVDAIYHCGAWVNLIVGYPFLKGSNVDGTFEVLKFATHRRSIPLHHISTLGVMMRNYGEGTGVVTEDPTPPLPLNIGYYESKWVSERLVSQAQARGLPATVYRPGAILGDSANRLLSPSDWLMQITLASLRVGATPEHEFMLPVSCADFTARCITDISRTDGSRGGTFHTTHPEPMPLDTYFEKIRSCRPHLRSVPFARWLDGIRSHYGGNDPMTRLAEAVPGFLPSPRNGVTTHAASDSARKFHTDRNSVPALDVDYFHGMLANLESRE